MKFIRCIIGLAAYVVVWLIVTGLVVLAIHAILPNTEGKLFGVDWAALPGSILGVLAGQRVYRLLSGNRLENVVR